MHRVAGLVLAFHDAQVTDKDSNVGTQCIHRMTGQKCSWDMWIILFGAVIISNNLVVVPWSRKPVDSSIPSGCVNAAPWSP